MSLAEEEGERQQREEGGWESAVARSEAGEAEDAVTSHTRLQRRSEDQLKVVR